MYILEEVHSFGVWVPLHEARVTALRALEAGFCRVEFMLIGRLLREEESEDEFVLLGEGSLIMVVKNPQSRKRKLTARCAKIYIKRFLLAN